MTNDKNEALAKLRGVYLRSIDSYRSEIEKAKGVIENQKRTIVIYEDKIRADEAALTALDQQYPSVS